MWNNVCNVGWLPISFLQVDEKLIFLYVLSYFGLCDGVNAKTRMTKIGNTNLNLPIIPTKINVFWKINQQFRFNGCYSGKRATFNPGLTLEC